MGMRRYANLGGNSGVRRFEIARGLVAVQFSDSSEYAYTRASVGPHNLRRMRQLALEGQGLNAFINERVADSYAGKR